jgi:peptidoglycan/LPS O-acetylase OafA/YrhL
MSHEPMKKPHLEQLTWLRGAAAYLVIISHSIRATEVKYSDLDAPSYFLPLSLFDLGSYAVALFFVLSGCTLWLSNGKMSGLRDVRHYYAKRVLRIWPAFLFSLLVYSAFIPIFQSFYSGPAQPHIAPFLTEDIDARELVSYVFLTFNITGPRGLFNGAYWSLPVEFQYYLILPLLIVMMRCIGIIGPILIGTALYLAFDYRLIQLNRYEVLNLAYTFCGGTLLGYLYERHSAYRIPRLLGSLMMLACLATVSSIYNGFLSPPPTLPWLSVKWNWYGLVGIFTVAIILFTDFGIAGSRIGKFFSKYGEISYSTYLFHNLFVGISILLIVNLGFWGDSTKLFLTLAFTSVASYFLALGTYRWIERPGIDFSRRLFKKPEQTT